MEYRVLKYFLTVAREQNITRASELLHISQPALSRQLMQLEEELGTQLFTRGWRNIALTDAGLLLFRRAQEIVELTEKTEREFRDEGNALGGIISIGSGEAESMRRLAELMRSFSDKFPNIRFDLFSNNADFIRERLERGLLDIGVLLEPADLSKYEYLRFGGKERWGASFRHPGSWQKKITSRRKICSGIGCLRQNVPWHRALSAGSAMCMTSWIFM